MATIKGEDFDEDQNIPESNLLIIEERPKGKMEKLTVVLDMDEMLIHTYSVSVFSKLTLQKTPVVKLKSPKKSVVQQLGAEVKYAEGKLEWTIKFIRRPWLTGFLNELASLQDHIEVIFWTASEKKYADAVLDSILPDSLRSCRKLYRCDCSASKRKSGGVYHYKDLKTIISPERLNRAVLFDDTGANLKACPDNGIICHRFMWDVDKEPIDPPFLRLVLNSIEVMIDIEDIREVVKEIEAELFRAVENHLSMRAISETERDSWGSKFSLATLFKGLTARTSFS